MNNIFTIQIMIYHLYINPGIGFVPRNDFSNMKIVEDMKDTENEDFNYYVKFFYIFRICEN